MKVEKPLDSESARQLIAKNRDAAGDAHDSDVSADYSADPQVGLETEPAHPQILRGLHPSLPLRPRVVFKLVHGGYTILGPNGRIEPNPRSSYSSNQFPLLHRVARLPRPASHLRAP